MINSPSPLLLVGSIPLGDVDAVLDAVADTIGARLASVPDGETGVRSNWIGWQHAVFALQDALEQGTEKERDYQLNPPYRFAPGKSAADIDFGDLGFAREAIKSYEAFAARRAAGRFAHDARFQVCLPTPFAPVFSFCAYDIQGDIYPLYERAMLMEIDAIRLAIPDRDLAIQWDVATEMSIFENLHPAPFLGDDPAPWLIATLARLGNAVPDGITLGFHLCYGSMGNTHWKEPEDLGICVSTASAIAKGVTRRIDFFHVPVPIDRDDDAYFAPMGDLSIDGDTLVYLGLIHGADGAEGAARRIAAARKHLDRFGLSTECGWGRMDAAEVVPLLELHRELLPLNRDGKRLTANQNLVAIAEFNTLPEALTAKGFLEQNGIGVSISQYHGTSSMGGMIQVGIPLYVAKADSPTAAELLASISDESPSPKSDHTNINLDTRRLWDWLGIFKVGCIILLGVAFAASVANNTAPPWWPF